MSSVDERIVEMRFDNQQFESGVQKSLKTLGQLKSGLNLEGSAKSLESLQASANAFDLSGVASGVDAISNRVSALGIVGDQVIRYLTNQFIQLGEAAASTVKSLTIDQIGTGFDKYERKTKAVQTIMNATGESIESVTESLEKLGWFTDETSYGYSDMVENIGKFTSNQIELDSAVTSMIGIANAAGLAGASVSDAAHAMDGFSKAMGRGSMDSRSWSWIQTAHMDTAQFKQTLIDSAVEVGTLDKVLSKDGQTYEYFVHGNKNAAVSIADFQNELSKGWLNVDAMTLALHQFGGATEEIYKIYQEHGGEMLTSDIISKYGGSLDELGVKAFKASQEARTFTDAIDSVKEAVSTGWANSFEYIFGNKEEAVALWSEVAEELYNIFAEPGNHRNELLKSWYEAGGRDELITGIRNTWEGIKAISEVAKEAFSDLFPSLTGEKLLGITKKFSGFTKVFKDNFSISEKYLDLFENNPERLELLRNTNENLLSEETRNALKAYENIEKLKTAFGGLASIASLVKSGFKALGKIFSPILGLFKINTNSVLDFAASLGSLITRTVDTIKSSKLLNSVIDGFKNVVSGAVKGIIMFGGIIKNTFEKLIKSDTFNNFILKIKEIANSFEQLVGEKVKKAFEVITNFFADLLKNIDADAIVEKINKAIEGLLKFIDFIKPLYNYIKSFIEPAIGAIESAFGKVYEKIKPVIESIKTFWQELTNSENPLELVVSKVKKFGQYINDLKNKFAQFFGYVDFSSLWESLTSGFDTLKQRVMESLEQIGEELRNLDWGKIAAIGLGLTIIPVILQIGAAFGEAAKLFKSTKGLIGSITGFFNNLNNSFKNKLVQTAKAVTLFSASIAILAGSLKLISTISSSDLTRSGIALGALAAGLTAITIALGVLGATKKIANLDKAAIAFAALSGSIAILSGSLLLLKNMTGSEIGIGIATILGLMLAVTTFATILSAAEPKLAGSGAFFLSFGASILMLVSAMKMLSSIENFNLEASFAGIAALMALMAAFAVIQRIGKSSFGLGPGILAMTISLVALMKLVDMLGEEKIASIINKAKKHIGLIAGIFIALIALSALTRLGGSNAGKMGLAILEMSASLLIIYAAIKKLGGLKLGVLSKGLVSVLLIFGAFSKLNKATLFSSYANKDSAKLGASMLAMAASLLVVYAAVKQFGKMPILELAQGIGSVIVLISAFTAAMRFGASSIKVGPILAMTAALTLLIGGLAYLSLFKFEDLLPGMAALSTVMVAFGTAVGLMGKASFDKTTFAGYMAGVIALLAIGDSLVRLQNIPWYQLLSSAGAISGCLLAISAAMKLASGTKFDVSALGGFAAGIAGIFVIGLMLNYLSSGVGSWENMLATAGSISAVLLAISGAMLVTSITPGGFTGSIAALGSMIVWIVGLSAVLGGLAYFADYIHFDDAKVAQVERIANMIGSFFGTIVGSFVSGIGLGITSALPNMASHLSSFMTNLSGFIEGVKSLPKGFDTKLEALGDGLIKIGKAEVKDAWANFLNMFAGIGKKQDPNLGANMKSLGEGLKDFMTATSQFTPEDLTSNVDSLVKMIGVFKSLPKKSSAGLVNNVAHFFGGETDYEGFTDGLSKMGTALGSFAESTKNINIEKMKVAATACSEVFTVFNDLPKTGGIETFFTGITSWDTVSTGLESFGKALVGFSGSVSAEGAIDINKIKTACTAAKELITVFNEIPENGATIIFDRLAILGGTSQWATISTGLVDFGTAITGFSNIVSPASAINVSKISETATAAKELIDIFRLIPDDGVTILLGKLSITNGVSEWSTISTGLTEFGSALVGYSNTITAEGGVNSTAITSASTAAQTIIDTILKFRDADVTNIELEELGLGLSGFGISLTNMSQHIEGFNIDAINNVLASIQALADAKETYSTLGGDIADSIVASFQTGLDSANAVSISGNFISSIVSSVASGASQLRASATNAVNSFVTGLRTGTASVITAGTALASGLVSSVASGVAGMQSVGAYAGQGLINGLASMYGAAFGAGLTLGHNVVAGARAGLNEHSPSKEMFIVGEFAGEGLGRGLLSMSSYVNNSAEKMAEGSILSVSSVFDQIDNALNGDIDFSPVITPVLDLSAVSYGASQINGILNNDATLRLAGQLRDTQSRQELEDLIVVGRSILREIQNGSDLYFDDGALAGRINRRLGTI